MAQTPYNAPIGVAYNHIANAGTFAVKTVPGALFALNINSGSPAATVTLFDQVGTATTTNTIAVINIGTADVLPLHLEIGPSGGGINFKNGLAALTTGTIDLTLAFR